MGKITDENMICARQKYIRNTERAMEGIFMRMNVLQRVYYLQENKIFFTKNKRRMDAKEPFLREWSIFFAWELLQKMQFRTKEKKWYKKKKHNKLKKVKMFVKTKQKHTQINTSKY